MRAGSKVDYFSAGTVGKLARFLAVIVFVSVGRLVSRVRKFVRFLTEATVKVYSQLLREFITCSTRRHGNDLTR
jgi:hypothetical protein